jgi:hypothetical protein
MYLNKYQNFETEFDNTQLNRLKCALACAKAQSRIEFLMASFDSQLIWSIKNILWIDSLTLPEDQNI